MELNSDQFTHVQRKGPERKGLEEKWYFLVGSDAQGPVSYPDLQRLAESGQLDRFTGLVWKDGMLDWAPAGTIVGLFPDPPPPPARRRFERPSSPPATNPEAQVPTIRRDDRSAKRPSSVDPIAIVAFISLILLLLVLVVVEGRLTQRYRHRAIAARAEGAKLEQLGQRDAAKATAEAEQRYRAYEKLHGGVGVLAGIFALVVLVVLHLTFCLWLSRTWSVLPQEYLPFSAAKAVGYLFIPIFNLYWVFRVFPELSAGLREALQQSATSRGVMTGYPLAIALSISFLVPCLLPLTLILLGVWVVLVNRAKNKWLTQPLVFETPE
ncbi:MAG: DUF4339 domain-containing protein [Gemmataceae bacterium]